LSFYIFAEFKLALALTLNVYGVAGIGLANKWSAAQCFARPYTSTYTI